MGLLATIQRFIRGEEPTIVDYESYDPPTDDARAEVLGRVGPSDPTGNVGAYRTQQSYDSLLETVRELREQLDGQARRQEELLSRLTTLPQATEALPQTSRMQSDLLEMINQRLATHAQQQRKIGEVAGKLGEGRKDVVEVLQSIREQIEMGNEIDRQLIDSFNRFSLMIDRLQLANQHAVECLQQVRDSYAATAMQMQDWVAKSRQKSTWLIAGAFIMSAVALIAVIFFLTFLAGAAR